MYDLNKIEPLGTLLGFTKFKCLDYAIRPDFNESIVAKCVINW